ncbi:hypothetical protein ACRAWD_09160 [Caulobacter segnis]
MGRGTRRRGEYKFANSGWSTFAKYTHAEPKDLAKLNSRRRPGRRPLHLRRQPEGPRPRRRRPGHGQRPVRLRRPLSGSRPQGPDMKKAPGAIPGGLRSIYRAVATRLTGR